MISINCCLQRHIRVQRTGWCHLGITLSAEEYKLNYDYAAFKKTKLVAELQKYMVDHKFTFCSTNNTLCVQMILNVFEFLILSDQL